MCLIIMKIISEMLLFNSKSIYTVYIYKTFIYFLDVKGDLDVFW